MISPLALTGGVPGLGALQGRLPCPIAVDPLSRVHVPIAAALGEAEALVLATNPDREGEAIAWQVLTWLEEKDALGARPVRRVVFHEVTRDAVRAAMERPRELDMDLVRAQQARRALDYLVGFHLSPVLWRKVRGGRSAGRVQSVTLRLVCAREAEIEGFVPREYWAVEADVMAERGGSFTARLGALDGEALDRHALATGKCVEEAARRVREGVFRVAKLVRRQHARDRSAHQPVVPSHACASIFASGWSIACLATAPISACPAQPWRHGATVQLAPTRHPSSAVRSTIASAARSTSAVIYASASPSEFTVGPAGCIELQDDDVLGLERGSAQATPF